jgi:hypothetical protein
MKPYIIPIILIFIILFIIIYLYNSNSNNLSSNNLSSNNLSSNNSSGNNLHKNIDIDVYPLSSKYPSNSKCDCSHCPFRPSYLDDCLCQRNISPKPFKTGYISDNKKANMCADCYPGVLYPIQPRYVNDTWGDKNKCLRNCDTLMFNAPP